MGKPVTPAGFNASACIWYIYLVHCQKHGLENAEGPTPQEPPALITVGVTGHLIAMLDWNLSKNFSLGGNEYELFMHKYLSTSSLGNSSMWQGCSTHAPHLIGGAEVEGASLGEDLDLGEEVPDGRAGLVDGGDDDAPLLRQPLHALHYHQRGIAVQACSSAPAVRRLRDDPMSRAPSQQQSVWCCDCRYACSW